jgi:hypothetical protein
MLLTLRHEWRLKSTEKYALDRVLGVYWEFSLFVSSSLVKRSIAPYLVQVGKKKWRKLPSDLWADFPRVALSTRARCGLQKNRFFYRALSGVCCLSSRDIRPVFIGREETFDPATFGSATHAQAARISGIFNARFGQRVQRE